MEDEEKLFSFMELKAMCMLCAGEAMMVYMNVSQFSDEKEARKYLENKIEDIINIIWKNPDEK